MYISRLFIYEMHLYVHTPLAGFSSVQRGERGDTEGENRREERGTFCKQRLGIWPLTLSPMVGVIRTSERAPFVGSFRLISSSVISLPPCLI